ncbi:MAG: AAA family ATPase [Planctomycetia bacterium]
MSFLQSIRLSGFLSFPPDSPATRLTSLNILIGPNGSGKSNLIESLEVLRATPTALAALVREGGTAQEWLWKGEPSQPHAAVEVKIARPEYSDLLYRLSFAPAGQRMEVVDEVIEEQTPRDSEKNDVIFYYRFQNGRPALNVRNKSKPRGIKREDLVPDESVLSQRKDPDAYPEVTWLGRKFSRIQIFRNWSFGRNAPLRRPQPADLPTDDLLEHSDNLGLVLNEIQHSEANNEFNRLLSRFLPRFERFGTRVHGNTVQFYLHEANLRTPVPATRLSDGTIRFMAILALLLSPTPPPLLCIDEPELGLHPDAVSLLADLLVEASQRMQLVVTTHSDVLVSALSSHADSFLICEHAGGTHLNRIEPATLKHWLKTYRLGELWRIGQLGGNP